MSTVLYRIRCKLEKFETTTQAWRNKCEWWPRINELENKPTEKIAFMIKRSWTSRLHFAYFLDPCEWWRGWRQNNAKEIASTRRRQRTENVITAAFASNQSTSNVSAFRCRLAKSSIERMARVFSLLWHCRREISEREFRKHSESSHGRFTTWRLDVP